MGATVMTKDEMQIVINDQAVLIKALEHKMARQDALLDAIAILAKETVA